MTERKARSASACLERGFKTWAENTSVSLRTLLRLKPTAPLCPFDLAKHLQVHVLQPSDISELNASTQQYLITDGASEWSAVTVRIQNDNIIIYNPTHTTARRANDLMHELSHIIRGHEPAQVVVSPGSGICFRTYKDIHEEEANWLGACLLLPRTALTFIQARRMSDHEAVSMYGVSEELFRFRKNVTGISRQFNRFGHE